MGREKSDDRIVPSRRVTASVSVGRRKGKAVTASEQMELFERFSETADSPKGATVTDAADRSATPRSPVPKSEASTLAVPSAARVMTMEEIRRNGVANSIPWSVLVVGTQSSPRSGTGPEQALLRSAGARVTDADLG